MFKPVKPKAESRLKLNIKALKDMGVLSSDSKQNLEWISNGRVISSMQVIAYETSIDLCYSVTVNGQVYPMMYALMLDKTPCHFGGHRHWFICPSCGRRIGVLYLGQKQFACRHCLNLAYESQCESKIDTYNRRLSKYRKRLNWFGTPVPFRPRYMHHKTFVTLRDEAIAAFNQSSARLMTLFNRLEKKLSSK